MENQIQPIEDLESNSNTSIHQFNKILNNIYYQPKKIVVKLSSPEMGLGVFATEDIKEGELIERCPMIEMGWKSRYVGDPQIFNYLYSNQSCKCDDCKKHGNAMYMVLGYGMLYNHRDIPNTIWVFSYKKLLGDVVAIDNIKAGEEIFVSYGKDYFSCCEKLN
jgi:SET domain-containing protein